MRSCTECRLMHAHVHNALVQSLQARQCLQCRQIAQNSKSEAQSSAKD